MLRGKEKKSSIRQWRYYVLINVRSILSSKDIRISGEKKENFHSNRTEGWWNRLGLSSTFLFALFQDWDQVDLSFTDPLLVMLCFSTGEKSLGQTVLPSRPMEHRLWKYIFQCICSCSVCTNLEPLDKFCFFFQVWGEGQGGRRKEPSAECLQSFAATFCTARENWSLPLVFSPKLSVLAGHILIGEEN